LGNEEILVGRGALRKFTNPNSDLPGLIVRDFIAIDFDRRFILLGQ